MRKPLYIDTSVKKLGALLAEVEQGGISVPPFQREFVWQRERVKALFDSINKNYPIGSLLLWKPAENYNWENNTHVGPYTLSSDHYEDWYVLDGFQRLSTMFGCLTNPNKTMLVCDEQMRRDYFALCYDLKSEDFFFMSNTKDPRPYQIPVYALMSAIDLRQYSRKYMENKISDLELDDYLTKADNLAQKIANFDIACIKIANANIQEAVEIFSRLNTQGVKMSSDWIVNALSYSDNCPKFSDKITSLLKELKKFNFHGLSREAIFRCFQSSFGKMYFDESNIEGMARRNDFDKVTSEVIPFIIKSVEFLHDGLNVLNHKLLPYNIQLIFFMEFFRQLSNPTEQQLEDLKYWFWKTSYCNYFTVNTLSVQRNAYSHFETCLKEDKTEDLFYCEDNNQAISTMPFPSRINLKAVRSRALELFLLNHFSNNDLVSLSGSNPDYDLYILEHKSDIIKEEKAFVQRLGIIYSEDVERSIIPSGFEGPDD